MTFKQRLISFAFCTLIIGCSMNKLNHNQLQEKLTSIDVNGSKQWLLISTKKAGSPLLLFVHGGPGSVLLPFAHAFDEHLRKDFTVVHWDQRLAGKSFTKKDISENINIQTYVYDCKNVVKYLKEKYPDNKLYIVGHSWGSAIGVLAAKELGRKINGYVGVGQLVNDIEGQKLGYDYALKKVQDTDDLKSIQALGNPPFSNAEKRMALSSFVTKYGGVFKSLSMKKIGEAISTTPHYSKGDLKKQEDGFKVSIDLMTKELLKFDARKSVPNLTVPAWFIQGSYDYATPEPLVKDFFNKLNAVNGKKLIEMNKSGHFPFWDEPKEFAKILRSELK